MYKLTNHNSIIRLSDNAFIPTDSANTDYQAYLKWVADGNTPEPAEPELAQEPVQELVTDPLEKLKAFLQANPDVQAILGA